MKTSLASLIATLPLACAAQISQCELGKPDVVRAHHDQVSKFEAQQSQLVKGTQAQLSASPSPARRKELLTLLAEAEGPLAQAIRNRREHVWCPVKDERTHAYIDEIQRRIEECGTRNFPTLKGKKIYGAPHLEFIIDSSGALLSVKVIRASKNPTVDAHAVRIVEASAPFGTLPIEITRNAFRQVSLASTFKFLRENNPTQPDLPVRQCSM